MEQKTEASQAVDEQVLPHLPRAVGYRHTMDNTEGLKGNKPVVVFCATKPNPFGIPGLDYSASFPVTTETLFTADQMRAYARAALKAQPAPTEAAQGALSVNPNLTTSAPTCQPSEAQGNTSNNSSSLQPAGNTGEAAQGEDSARLDYLDAWAARNKEEGWDEFQFGFNANEGTAREQIDQDRARASAETGGVKS